MSECVGVCRCGWMCVCVGVGGCMCVLGTYSSCSLLPSGSIAPPP